MRKAFAAYFLSNIYDSIIAENPRLLTYLSAFIKMKGDIKSIKQEKERFACSYMERQNTIKIIKYLSAVLIITFMVGVSEILNEREIIFPEIAAIAIGAFIAPKFAWNTNYKRIFILICLSAVTGVLIVKYIPLPIAWQGILAFFLSQVIFINSGTSFAPMISAMVLPVLLQTTSYVYIISAVALTLLILALRFILEKCGISEKVSYSPLPAAGKNTWVISFLRIAAGGIVLAAAVSSGHQFAAAPPFLVAFTEMSKPCSKAVTSPVRVFALLSACGITGAAVRYIFTVKLAVFPLAVSAMLTTIIVLFIMETAKMFIPPAGAIGILAMLIPAEKVVLYPLECIAGSLIVVLASNLLAFIIGRFKLS